MIHFFYGDDSYESYLAAKQKLAELTKATNAQEVVLDADTARVSDLTQHLGATTLFSQSTVVLAKRLLQNSHLADYVDQNLAEIQKHNLIIWEPEKVDKRTTIVKKLIAEADSQEFELPKAYMADKWLIAQASDFGLKLSSAQARYLLERVGFNKGALVNELQKLKIYVGNEQKISDAQLESGVGVDKTGDIWKFLDSLTKGRLGEAIAEFDQLQRFGGNDQYLIAMLGRELWLLSQVLYAQARGQGMYSLGIDKFVLEKTVAKANRFSWDLVNKLYLGLIRLDLAIKQGRLAPDDGLFIYLFSWPRA